jgi:hypothetical protein
MLSRFRKYWAGLGRGRPGSRFQDQFDAERKKQKSPAGRIVRTVGGLLLIPVGVLFLAIPGPGLVVIALGAVLIAREFGFAARLLDATELRGRKTWKWAEGRWRRLAKARRVVTR